MDYIAEIAKQGLGYLLFAGSVGISIFQERQKSELKKDNRALQVAYDVLADKRVNDLKEIMATNRQYITDMQDKHLEALSKIKDITANTLTNLQNLASRVK